MPIRPENKARYPPKKEWELIRAEIKERAKNRCEFCGVENHDIGVRIECEFISLKFGGWKPSEKWSLKEGTFLKVIRIVCTVMHLDHQPENNDRKNLKFGCQQCHNRYDQEHRKSNRIKNRAVKKAANSPQMHLDELIG